MAANRHSLTLNSPPERPRRWPVHAAIGAVLLLVVGVGVWLVSGPPRLTPTQAEEIATAFLSDVRDGRIDEAWAATSVEFKSAYGRDRFHDLVRSKKRFRVPAVCESCVMDLKRQPPIAECVFRTEANDARIKVILSPEEGVWKVGGISTE